MASYVGQEKFLKWYRETALRPLPDAKALELVFSRYCADRKSDFTLSAEETVSGHEESFPFRVENLGCCGASTIMVYFR